MQSINVSHHVRCTTNAPLESTSTHTQHNTEYTLQSNEHIVLVNNNNNKRMQTAEWNTSWHKATQRRMPIRRTLTDTRNKLFHRQKCRHIFFFCGYLFFSAFTYNNWTNKQVRGAPVNERWKKNPAKICVRFVANRNKTAKCFYAFCWAIFGVFLLKVNLASRTSDNSSQFSVVIWR